MNTFLSSTLVIICSAILLSACTLKNVKVKPGSIQPNQISAPQSKDIYVTMGVG